MQHWNSLLFVVIHEKKNLINLFNSSVNVTILNIISFNDLHTMQ